MVVIIHDIVICVFNAHSLCDEALLGQRDLDPRADALPPGGPGCFLKMKRKLDKKGILKSTYFPTGFLSNALLHSYPLL